MKNLLARKNRWLTQRREAARERFGAAAGDEARRFNRLDEAIEHYQAHLKRRPRDFGIRLRLVGVLREVGRLAEAAALLEKLIARRPHELNLQAIRAEIFDEAGDQEAAERIYAAILHKDPSNHTAARATAQIRQALSASTAALPPPPPDSALGQGSIEGSGDPLVITTPGTVLRDEATGWFAWAIRQGATAAYADHEGPNREIRLQAAPHPLDLATNPFPPSAAAFAPDFLREGEGVRTGLMRALAQGETVVHLPLILSRQGDERELPTSMPAAMPTKKPVRLLVVIPTRDSTSELAVMVNSLGAWAARPELLDIVVVDNGSQTPLRQDALRGEHKLAIDVLRVDEPFNWSRLNNLACVGRDQPIVVFANNDMEMLSLHWDDRLRGLLDDERVGVVGARLLYSNGLLQHGGIVMGGRHGEPLHDGWRVCAQDVGPMHRWVRSRPATAVTGGFLATKRSLFDDVRGFDEVNLPVSCSDVDYCLKAGALGQTVLYAAEIELFHHESLTRGHAHTSEEKKLAVKEMHTLLDRWGKRAAYDPMRNPQWETRGVRLYAGRRALTAEEVVEWALTTQYCASDHPVRE
ncbi:tetratricopeptide repeat protein [Brevundimonas phoenicis]|uniref:tetratricopeptide repeat protein n=1 Tax=unclassified Brevundimonas TaxID=2622653 RepID=UPI0039A06A89